jgi:hypothetical protein
MGRPQRRLSPVPALGVVLGHRFLRAEQEGFRVGPEPFFHDRLRLGSEHDHPGLAVMLVLVARWRVFPDRARGVQVASAHPDHFVGPHAREVGVHGPANVTGRLRSLLDDYWKHSGGITVDEARSLEGSRIQPRTRPSFAFRERAKLRGRRELTNEQFHARLFQRIVDSYAAGKFRFLTAEDLADLRGFIARLGRR